MKKFLAAGLVAASLAIPTVPVLAQGTDAGGGTTMQDQSAPKKSTHKKKMKKRTHKKTQQNKSM